MRPMTARLIITVTILGVAALGVGVVNSKYHGSFIVGLLVIVLPVLFLSYLLPLVIPVKCVECGGRMRFRFRSQLAQGRLQADETNLYGYVCEGCAAAYLWEGSTSGSALD